MCFELMQPNILMHERGAYPTETATKWSCPQLWDERQEGHQLRESDITPQVSCPLTHKLGRQKVCFRFRRSALCFPLKPCAPRRSGVASASFVIHCLVSGEPSGDTPLLNEHEVISGATESEKGRSEIRLSKNRPYSR